ncbi:hypothetical protein DMJ13_24580 [halophilic archaeon]|nr:hypothetical protein DMJ13_24580 [halophilic archaeon]
MSSRTPKECVDLAVDESASKDRREDAIQELKTANECDELEKLVRMDGLDDRYRERALRALATPQCDSTLRELVEEGPLDESLRESATELLREVEENAE